MLTDHIPDCAQRLHCSDADKAACLSMVAELLCLWNVIRKDGPLAIGYSYTYQIPDPFCNACLQDASEWMRTDKEPMLEALFAKYLIAGDYRGGDFLRNVVAAEGILAFLQMIPKKDENWPSFRCWGERLAIAVQGYFGVEYRDRVRVTIRREIQKYHRAATQSSFLPEFDTLADLPPQLCRRLLLELPEDMRIALKHASGKVQDHVLSVLSQNKREAFDDEMELYANLPESDVEAAQRRVLEKAASYDTGAEKTLP